MTAGGDSSAPPASEVWERARFRWGDEPDRVCPATIDVTGPARVLLFGPYVPLPPGLWRAEIAFDLCEQGARRTYLVEFGAGADLSRQWSSRLRPGRNTICVEHNFEASAIAEIRLWVARAAFHGGLRFLGATVLWERQRADEGLMSATPRLA